MDYPEELPINRLERCTYRTLQQMAKSMGLPSNVKKVYLIEMIYAKKHRSEEELDAIVSRIKDERKLLSKVRKPMKSRKRRIQGTKISSTRNLSSPLSLTSQHSDYIITYPPSSPIDCQTLLQYQQANILLPTTTRRNSESDRVLRSFNNRLRPNYSILNINNSVIGVLKAQNALKQSQGMQERQYELNMTLQRHRPYVVGESLLHRAKPDAGKCRPVYSNEFNRRRTSFEDADEERQLVPVSRTCNISPRPAKRIRRISGIYELEPEELSHNPHIPSVGVRRPDGGISKINAVVQKLIQRHNVPKLTASNNVPKPAVSNKTTQTCVLRTVPKSRSAITVKNMTRPNMITAQDVVQYKIDRQTFSNSSTDSARDSNTEIEHVPGQSNHRSHFIEIPNRCEAGIRRQATINMVRYTERNSYTTENPNRYIEYSSHDTENVIRRPKNKNYASGNSNQYAAIKNHATTIPNWYPLNRTCGTKNLNKCIEHGSHPVQNPNRYTETNQNRYIENRSTIEHPETDYISGHANRNIESRNYTETPSRYTESKMYIAEPQNRFTDIAYYPTETANIGSENLNSMDIQKETCNVEADYPNMSALTDVCPESQFTELRSTDSGGNFTVYYHKKIRAEKVRSQRTSISNQQQTVHESLPRFTDVFSRYNDDQYRNLTQPIYVQVSEESERFPYSLANSSMLEHVYNYKNQFLSSQNEPLLKIASSTTNTMCVYSTPTITTPIAQPTGPARSEHGTHPYERDSNPYTVEADMIPRVYGDKERRDFRCHEVLSSSSSSLDTTSSQLGANVTIPEMVEDALELISQDGDYMERIEMDVRMQCILCDWAGPKIIMENHIAQEHPSSIVERNSLEWWAVFSVAAVTSRHTCSYQLSRYRSLLYILSVRYLEDNTMMATLAVLPTITEEIPKYSRLTVYNKVTGEPFTWEGNLTYLPETIPYETDGNGLKLDITRLDLLPNSANLKLVNGELVTNSTSKVIVGQPELNNIEIAVYVEVFD